MQYRINYLAKILGIHKATIHRYEAKGYLPKAKRNPFTKHRIYTDEDIEIIKKLMQGNNNH